MKKLNFGGNRSFYVMYRGINLKFYITIDTHEFSLFYYSGPDSQSQANLSDLVLLYWENIPCTICIRYLCWEWDMMFKCTCWDRRSQSLRSPPGLELHRKTWAYRAEATGSQSLSWCDRLENRTEHHHEATQNYLHTTCQKINLRWHTGGDPVLQRALIEDVWRERTEGWVHAVLHLQTDGSDAQHHQPLKQRLRQTCFSRLLAHDHRTQLTVVPH